MKHRNDRVIVTDVDGVLLNWVDSFEEFAAERGFEKYGDEHYSLTGCYEMSRREERMYTKWHNESVRLYHLSPMRDAVKFVRRLHEWHGYVLHCVTALDPHPYVQKAREQNLKNLFGPAIERVILTGSHENKRATLEEYRDSNCVWVEDKPSNADLGVELGLDTLLMDQSYNRKYNNEKVQRVGTWSEIYDHVVGA